METTDTTPAPNSLPTLVDRDGNVIKRQETWPRSDWRHLVKAQQICNERNVGVAIICGGCSQPLMPVGREGDGAVIVDCACTTRKWVAF